MNTVRALIAGLEPYIDDTIPQLCQRPEFINLIQAIDKKSPTKAKSKITKTVRKKKANKADISLASILQVKDADIGLCQPESQEVDQFLKDVFPFESLQPNFQDGQSFGMSQVYITLAGIESRRQRDTILRRFHVVFFYDWVASFGRQRLSKYLETRLLETIVCSNLVNDSEDNILKNLRRWVLSGHRYAHLSRALGGGALFLLPTSVSDNNWEHLPLRGHLFEQAIQHLVNRGHRKISLEMGAGSLELELRNLMLRRVRPGAADVSTAQSLVTSDDGFIDQAHLTSDLSEFPQVLGQITNPAACNTSAFGPSVQLSPFEGLHEEQTGPMLYQMCQDPTNPSGPLMGFATEYGSGAAAGNLSAAMKFMRIYLDSQRRGPNPTNWKTMQPSHQSLGNGRGQNTPI